VASGRHFAKLEAGDLAAVTRAGDVFRLNPYKLDFTEIEQRLTDVQRRMPSVTETRARFDTARENKTAFWEQIHADNAAQRANREKAYGRQQTMRGAATATLRAAAPVNRAVNVAGKGAGIIGRGLGLLAKFAEWLDLFPAKPPSPEQQERNYQAAKEQQATDDIAATKEARLQAILRQINRDDQEQERKRRERGGYDDDYGRGRDR
jgi:hypothetical protein